ncbi:hypothetical protein O5D80_000084 [Batrachochytrium dendrobatidis]|nr:hypothetical protein O5D80_000084 [Batrachochytrium dendrobatidis]
MKLSITVLSSILAVCSVTIANPVDPSSTTSIESTSNIAAPSETSIATGEPDYSKYPSPYNLYESYCHPIRLDGVVMIQLFASSMHMTNQIKKEINKKIAEIKSQRKALRMLEQTIGSLANRSQGLATFEVKVEIKDQTINLKKLGQRLKLLIKKHSRNITKEDKLQLTLYYHLVEYDTTGQMTNEGLEGLYKNQNFLKCFYSFYDRLSK